MKQLQWLQWIFRRRYGSYVKVKRPDSYKIVQRPTDEAVSLAQKIDVKIKAGGPITVADYMRTCLTNPSIGYYMHKDMIGRQGDFVTSPEISQIFGEMIATWVYHEFSKIGSPKPWQIVELGPGKGTLMKDVLRSLTAFKATEDLSAHMVEISPHLACVQAHRLCGDVVSVGDIPRVYQGNPYYRTGKTTFDVPISWYDSLDKVPKAFSVILAHEFFDALPIHKFQRVDGEWREVLVNSTVDESGKVKFQYSLSKSEPSMSKLLIRADETREHVEVCPEAGAIAKKVADRLEEFGGFTLFIDYGHNGDKTDTFRAFKKHALMDPLVNPGSADLTADVDFSFLREVMKDQMFICGPVDQGEFLRKMGIDIRLKMLLESADEEEAKNLTSGCRMIVDADQMGTRYKCFAAFPSVLESHLKRFPVAGFS